VVGLAPALSRAVGETFSWWLNSTIVAAAVLDDVWSIGCFRVSGKAVS
jgi:hypothetical protein